MRRALLAAWVLSGAACARAVDAPVSSDAESYGDLAYVLPEQAGLGEFAIEDVVPGQYALLAVGSGGIGLIGFELVDAVLQ